MSAKDRLYIGAPDSPGEKWQLKAGSLSLFFQDGCLRYIRFGELEVLRRIYFAMRDPNWGTVPAQIENLHCESGSDSFHIQHNAYHHQGEIDLAWKVSIEGDKDGITFQIEGVARNTFLVNRLGLCVLHPIEPYQGRSCWVEKIDGSKQECRFPKFISPIPPMTEMRAISYEIIPSLCAEVRFKGDIFEMEDQRNFGDSSYKIYARPSSLPKPFEVKEGMSIRQKVTLHLRDGKSPAIAHVRPKEVQVTIESDFGLPIPALGLRAPWRRETLGQVQFERLRALNLSHLRVDLKLCDPDYGLALSRTAKQARVLACPLEVALFCTGAAEVELEQLLTRLSPLDVRIQAWLLFHNDLLVTPTELVRLARKYLQAIDAAAVFGGGTNYAFAQVNMNRPSLEGWDFLCFPISPQIHLSDDDTLIENIVGVGYCVESARHLTSNLPIRVTPVSLKPHFYESTSYKDESGINGKDIDPRQCSLLGAGWMVGSLKTLAEAGASSATYFSTEGRGGIMKDYVDGTAGGKSLSPSTDIVYPIYHVFADVGEFTGGDVLRTHSSDPLSVQALAMRGKNRMSVLIANLTSSNQCVNVSNLPSQVLVRMLDEDSALEAMQDPEAYRSRSYKTMKTREGTLAFELKPYAIVRISK